MREECRNTPHANCDVERRCLKAFIEIGVNKGESTPVKTFGANVIIEGSAGRPEDKV